MGSDQDVHTPCFCLGNHLLLLRRGAKAAQHFHPNGESSHTLAKGIVVLEGEHRCGSQHGNLAAVLNNFERGAHGEFGLAVSHIAAE